MARGFLTILLTAVCFLCSSAAFGQFPRGGPDQGGDSKARSRSPIGEGPGGRRGRDRFARLEGFLRRMDTNGDGIIRADEVPEHRRGMLRMIGMRSGQDPAKGISIDKLRETMGGRRDRKPVSPGDSADKKDRRKGKTKQEKNPLIPGFGTDREPTVAARFGVRIRPTGRLVLGTEPKLDPRVRAMFDRFDRNHNGVLEQNEWVGLPGNVREFDRNRDGRITLAEVASHLSRRERGRRRNDDPKGHDDRAVEDDEKATSEKDRLASYRFLSAHERLPEGLPNWFVARDSDLDGQVTMAEFARGWTRSTVEAYFKYDANRDGVITPKECLATTDGSVVIEGPSRQEAKPRSRSSDSGQSKPWWLQ